MTLVTLEHLIVAGIGGLTPLVHRQPQVGDYEGFFSFWMSMIPPLRCRAGAELVGLEEVACVLSS